MAPDEGKVAAVQLIVSVPEAVGVPERELACTVAALESVRNVTSFPYTVPISFVT